jgi:hypothetical protein
MHVTLLDGILGLVPDHPVPVRMIYASIHGEPLWAIDAALMRLVREGKLVRVLDQIHTPGHGEPLDAEWPCKSCGKVLPAERFEDRGGYCLRTCKHCRSVKRLAARKRRREAKAAAGLKQCRCCRRWLLIVEHFAPRRSRKRADQYWATCNGCRKRARLARKSQL